MNRITSFLALAAFVGISVIGAYSIAPQAWESHRLENEHRELTEQLYKLEQDVNRKRQKINDLSVNPAVVERVAREKFGLARPGERVAVFVDEDLYRKTVTE